MNKFIQFLFGKPCQKGETFQYKFARFVYWFAVVLFLFAAVFFGSLALFAFKTEFIIAFVNTLIFPFVPFRLVYHLFLKMNGLKKEE